MTYDEAIQWLYDLRLFGLKFGLENTRRLAELAGNPHDGLRFIHVAGTNGKGSTCAMLESVYRAAGLRVGLFTSPHLVSFSERIQVNRVSISRAEVVRQVEQVREFVRLFPSDHSPTFFEAVTVMALRHFAAEHVDLVIWETGLGGRLDATNIVTPLVSVITNVRFDHQPWLGNTLAKIASEKAGIIKLGVPVVAGANEPEAMEVIRETARRLDAPLRELTSGDYSRPPLDHMELPLMGEHQRRNAALALAAIESVRSQLPTPAQAIERGLKTVDWPGRLQTIRTAPGLLTLLDGAHNPDGVESLRAALQCHFGGLRPAFIIGVLKDKDWPAMCHMLAPLASAIYLTPVASSRSAAPDELRAECLASQPAAPIHACGSLAEALRLTEQAPLRVITGSLYLVGEALERLAPTQSRPQNERGLNEWQPTGDRR